MMEAQKHFLEQLLTEAQAAEILNCTPRALQRWRGVGEGPIFIKVGRLCRYRRSDLEAYIQENTRRSTSDAGGE